MTTSTTSTTASQIVEPAILSANTYFWRPSSVASGRRSNEARQYAQVESWLAAIAPALQTGGFTVEFSYSESCHNVYKRVVVCRGGKRSNLLALRNLLARASQTVAA